MAGPKLTLKNTHATVVVDPARTAVMLRDPSGPVVRDLLVRGERVKQEAIRLAPVGKGPKGGTLRDAIVKRLGANKAKPEVLVGIFSGPARNYVLYVINGTEPHTIVANRAQALSFEWPKAGGVVFFKKVNHPGTKPNNFLLRALEAAAG